MAAPIGADRVQLLGALVLGDQSAALQQPVTRGAPDDVFTRALD
ncbi:hypothetical protein SAMN05661080_02992 [Modestobacter sp. DSM 44400]|nr:hypothetical protein [Modestobacter sp. DSM 44400]SDY29865.1 hypothetical protein SAMN05661080_02992 [Modestobacter sp. DSM 44400]